MLLSAGLTPAWQQMMVFRAFRVGEVNRASEVLWRPQGKVINVGIAAHSLGGPSLTLATVGGPPLVSIDCGLAELGVPRRWVVTDASTRVCTTILDQATGTMTELVENGRPLKPEELEEFRNVYSIEAAKADVAVITGSLPAGAPASYYRELVERTPCPAVLDFRGEGLLNVLDLGPLVVKPNREELAATLGRSLEGESELLEAMRSLNARGARWVVVTQGAGPVLVTSATKTYRIQPPKCDVVVNPLGSGDAMAAAIAWAVCDGRELIDAVRFGIAAAVDNLRQLEVCRLDRASVEQLEKEIPPAEEI